MDQILPGGTHAAKLVRARLTGPSSPVPWRAVLGLPDEVTACLFDLDGVLTPTAEIHAKAWKETFDEFLAHRGGDLDPFNEVADYDEYVDGKPRYDGVKSFLQSRGIELARGHPDDAPGEDTIDAIGNAKNERVLKLIREQGVEAYPGSLTYLRAAIDAGLRRAVVSSSTNCRDVLQSAGLIDLVEEIVDGVVAAHENLSGKPAPDTFLAAAAKLGVEPSQAAVFEDALAGVQAGRSGEFGFVVGVDRVGQADALKAHGADTVVSDLADLLTRP